MRHRTAVLGLLAVIAVNACARNPKPKRLGDDLALAPTLEVKSQERGGPHLLLKMPKQAYINAFLVTPGEETLILFPTASTTGTLLDVGDHELTTAFGQRQTTDTASVLRGGRGGARVGLPPGGGGRQAYPGYVDRRWVLVYASQDSIPLGALQQKIIGFTVPGYPDEALQTVARSVRSISPRGQWAAVAVEYMPY